jgi:hypothetical protein
MGHLLDVNVFAGANSMAGKIVRRNIGMAF